ncbi:response regulator [Pendulispora albinea]|uniref:Response regulator n=1 Tax=Pendulispora albinea TaxID=2741071 RepID=A0ABZ2LSD1_9BACT
MKRILLVDDEYALVDTLRDFLEDEGYLVESANDGQKALDLMAMHPPDLLISDVMMPIMDGKALLRFMRNEEALRAVPVVLVSAVRRQISLPATEDIPPFAAFLRKPFQLEKLLTIVASLIGPGEKKSR